MRKVLSRILTILFMLFVLVFVGFQAVRYFSQVYVTETALMYSTNASVNTVGVAVRGERPLLTEKQNVVGYVYEDGSKVAQGRLVTQIYTNRTALNMSDSLKRVDAEISMLEDAQNTGMTFLANTEALSGLITSGVYALLDAAEDGDLTEVFDARMDYMSAVNKRQIAVGKETDYQARINRLENQRVSLTSAVPDPIEVVYMPITGYFSSVTDGLEDEYTPESLLNASVEEVQQMLNASDAGSSTVVGKIITDFNWYFAVVVSRAEADMLRSVGSVSAAFPTVGISDLPLTLYSYEELPDASPADMESPVAVIFTCNYMNAELSALRVQNVELSMRTFNGLRVSKEAIRFRNNLKGVYVQVGYNLRFKSIEGNILYENKDFVLVTPSDDSNELQQYDEVVVRGMGLYDGKAV